MIRLSEEQFETIRRDEHVFVGWYVEEILKNYFPKFYFALTPEGRWEMVSNGRKWASCYQLQTTEAQGHFISLMFEIGANFHLFPGFHDVLRREDVKEMAKIDRVFSDVSDAQARRALDGADDSYWYVEPKLPVRDPV